MQAGHFGQAVFDPAGLTDDYKRQAEVSILAFSKHVDYTRTTYACFATACSLSLHVCKPQSCWQYCNAMTPISSSTSIYRLLQQLVASFPFSC